MKNWIAKKFCMAAAVFLLGAMPAYAAPETGPVPMKPYPNGPKATALDKQLLAAMEENHLVGLTAVVIKDGKVVWSGGYGWADLRTGREAKPETIFRTASISKMVTGTAVMQLYEQGKCKLDEDISKYLGYPVKNPQYPDVPITLRQLLTHTSSILDSGSYDKFVEETPQMLPDVDIRDMLTPEGSYYVEGTYASYRPGTQFNYSNFGIAILASVVEKVSGMSFDKYCNQYIFGPLKMDASFEAADIKNWKNIGVLYRPDKTFTKYAPIKDEFAGVKPLPTQGKAPNGSALGHSPAGGVRMNVLDLSKFMLAHINRGSYEKTQILKPDTADMMHQMQWFGEGMDGFYKQKGLTFHVTDDLVAGQRMEGHSAEAYGLIGDAYFDPDTKFGLAFLINGGSYTESNPFYKVENEVAETLYREFAPRLVTGLRNIQGKVNDSVITVNQRKIFMPVAAAAVGGKKKVFVPEISAADALKLQIHQEKSDCLSFTANGKKVVVTVGQKQLDVGGKKVDIGEAVYKKDGHIMVPIAELQGALGIRGDIQFK